MTEKKPQINLGAKYNISPVRSNIVLSEHDVGAVGGAVELDGNLGAVNFFENLFADDLLSWAGAGDLASV